MQPNIDIFRRVCESIEASLAAFRVTELSEAEIEAVAINAIHEVTEALQSGIQLDA